MCTDMYAYAHTHVQYQSKKSISDQYCSWKTVFCCHSGITRSVLFNLCVEVHVYINSQGIRMQVS